MSTRYPVILNGDHAEFEAEWAGRDPKERPDWPLPSFDARDWAEAFCKTDAFLKCEIDEGMMVAWFANALMRGYDEARALASCDGNPEGENPKGSSREAMTARCHEVAGALIERLKRTTDPVWQHTRDEVIQEAISALSSSKARIETLETALKRIARQVDSEKCWDIAARTLSALRSKGETGDAA